MRLKGSRAMIAGGGGFLGTKLGDVVQGRGGLVLVPRAKDYDLSTGVGAMLAYSKLRPDVVFNAAGKVGGIAQNAGNQAGFFLSNLLIGVNLLDTARLYCVEKFIQVGSACAYPASCLSPNIEGDILEGAPEATNAGYASAKRALLAMGQAYRKQYGMNIIHAVLANLYGPGQNVEPESSHVVGGMLNRISNAIANNEKTVRLWGTGRPVREFLYVDDAADALAFLAENYESGDPINVGSGDDVCMVDLAETLAEMLGFHGKITWDCSRPDGQMDRRLNNLAMRGLGWEPSTRLHEGLEKTVEWYKQRLKGNVETQLYNPGL